MGEKIVESFDVPYLQVMDKDGNVDEELLPDLSKEEILEMYRFMVYTRLLDEKSVSLQRQGRLGTYAPCTGEEAAEVGSAYAATEDDWLCPSYRENAVYLVRGFDPVDILLYAKGFEEGSAVPKEKKTLPPSIPVSSHLPHATGIAWANNIRDVENSAAIAYFGDGGTSEGDFHEALNFAGTFEAPAIFLCRNNQWAISTPREEQTASETLAQKAIAYGIHGIQVDGNDIFAVYKATQDALERAKEDGTPTLIECVTYRLSMHTTSDNPDAYRDEEWVEKRKEEGPIKRLRMYIEEKGWWDEEQEEALREEIKEELKGAVKEMEEKEPDPKDMFKYTYKEMPDNLKRQWEEYTELYGE